MALPKLLQKLFTNGGAGDKLNQDIIPDIPYSKITDVPSITVDSALSSTSENPVQNKVINSALDGKLSTSGGNVNGDITFHTWGAGIGGSISIGDWYGFNSGTKWMLGGNDGAGLWLSGNKSGGVTGSGLVKGEFQLAAEDGTKHTALRGAPDGSLSWTGTFYAWTLKAKSDKRKKTCITKMSADLSSLSAYRYKFKEPSEVDKGFHVGLIAQEVEKILPEAVSKDDKGFLTLDYNAVVAVLVDEVNQLKSEIKQLKAKLS